MGSCKGILSGRSCPESFPVTAPLGNFQVTNSRGGGRTEIHKKSGFPLVFSHLDARSNVFPNTTAQPFISAIVAKAICFVRQPFPLFPIEDTCSISHPSPCCKYSYSGPRFFYRFLCESFASAILMGFLRVYQTHHHLQFTVFHNSPSLVTPSGPITASVNPSALFPDILS